MSAAIGRTEAKKVRRQTATSRRREALAGLAMAVTFTWLLLFAPPASSQSQACPACVSFVTTFEGVGPPKTRMHRDLVANLPYALDVDGNLPPLPLGTLPILPGYEVSANVRALDASKPTITIKRLLGTPPALPLRIELVQPEGAAWTSFGYDTLTATAPQSFVADIDLSRVDRTLVDVTIRGAAKELTLVNEAFEGSPAGLRSDRTVRRARFSGDNINTRVPGRVTLDMTDTPTSQRIVATRDARTILDFDISEPGDDPRTTGTLNEMPARIDLTLTDVDLNADERPDTKIDLISATMVGNADLVTRTRERRTEVTVTELPSEAHLTYIGAPDPPRPGEPAPDPPRLDQTKIVYDANSRAKKLFVSHDDGKRRLVADVDDVPSKVNELSATSRGPRSGQIVYRSNGPTTRAEVDVFEGPKHAEAVVKDLPGEVTVDYASAEDSGRVHYVADGVATRADLMMLDEEGQRTTLGADQIPSDVLVDYGKPNPGDLIFDYVANDVVPEIEIHGTGYKSLPNGADELNVLFEDVPRVVNVDLRNDLTVTTRQKEIDPPPLCEPDNDDPPPGCPTGPRYEVTTERTSDESLSVSLPEGRLGRADIQLTSGPETRLPDRADSGRPQDGLLEHNLADGFVAHLRLTEFGGFTRVEHFVGTEVTNPTRPTRFWSHGNKSTVLTSGAKARAFALDLKSQGAEEDPITGMEAVLGSLPDRIQLDESFNSFFGSEETTWTAATEVPGGFEMIDTSQEEGQAEPVATKLLSLNPMPASFSVCQADYGLCSQSRFDDNIRHLANGNYDEYRTFACLLLGCAFDDFPISPTDANRGSFSLRAGTQTHVKFEDGDVDHRRRPFIDVDLPVLTDLAIQGHKETVDCVRDQAECEQGYVGMSTRGNALEGFIHKGGGDGAPVLLDFPRGFSANNLVWAFKETGPLNGRLATIGQLTCPDRTRVIFGDKEINERFCSGDLLEGNIFNNLPGM